MAFVQEGFSAFKSERKEKDRRSTKGERRFLKTSNFNESYKVRETKTTQSDLCSLVDGTQRIWNCPLFKNMNINDRYVAVRNITYVMDVWEKDTQSNTAKSTRAV